MAHRTQADLAMQWARAIGANQIPSHTTSKPPLRLEVLDDMDADRPRTRAECLSGPRPCPYVGCTHHLYLDVSPGGEIEERAHHLEPWEMIDTCALDIAERGWEPGGGRGPGATLEEVAEVLGVTRERVRQIEDKAISRLKKRGRPGSTLAALFEGMEREVRRGHIQEDDDDEGQDDADNE